MKLTPSIILSTLLTGHSALATSCNDINWPSSSPHAPNQIAGTWLLSQASIVYANGTRTAEFADPQPFGILILTRDLWLSNSIISQDGRSLDSAGASSSIVGNPAAEAGVIAIVGQYKVDETGAFKCQRLGNASVPGDGGKVRDTRTLNLTRVDRTTLMERLADPGQVIFENVWKLAEA